jgi:hypothetical protein
MGQLAGAAHANVVVAPGVAQHTMSRLHAAPPAHPKS